MGKLEKYTSYKESGVEWLGEIPEHWDVKRIKHLFSIGRGRVISQQELDEDGVFPVYSSQTKNNGVLGYIKTYDYDCKQITWTTDGANAGTVFLRQGKHNCTNVCGTLQHRNKNEVLEFVNYSLQIAAQFYKRPDTNGAKIMNNEMAGISITYPPKEEQTKIASFLDEKTAQIDSAINQKEKLIELLKERRQITINEAVTKGLDKAVEFKDSGVEWIGEIPKHWDAIRSKRLFQQRKDRARKGDKQLTASQKYGVIFQDEFMQLEGRKVTQVEHNYEILKRAEKGDFLISMRSFQGGIEYCRETGSVSSAYVALIPIKHVVPEYFKYLLKSQKYITALSSTSNLVRDGQALRFENFSMVDLLVIPEDEQVQIAEYIDKQTAKIDKAIELQQNYIAKLKEYKASLIDSVVTGKVRVCDE